MISVLLLLLLLSHMLFNIYFSLFVGFRRVIRNRLELGVQVHLNCVHIFVVLFLF